MAEENIDTTIEQLRELLSQQPEQEPLPRIGNIRKFGLAFAGALDPRFQRNIAGPLIRRDEQVPLLEAQRSGEARKQKIQELETLLGVLEAQGDAGRAAAAEARDVESHEQKKAKLDREGVERGEQTAGFAERHQEQVGSLPSIERRLSLGADDIANRLKGRELEASGAARRQNILGQLAEFKANVERGPTPGFEELHFTELEKDAEALDELLNDGYKFAEERDVAAGEVKDRLDELERSQGAPEPEVDQAEAIVGPVMIGAARLLDQLGATSPPLSTAIQTAMSALSNAQQGPQTKETLKQQFTLVTRLNKKMDDALKELAPREMADVDRRKITTVANMSRSLGNLINLWSNAETSIGRGFFPEFLKSTEGLEMIAATNIQLGLIEKMLRGGALTETEQVRLRKALPEGNEVFTRAAIAKMTGTKSVFDMEMDTSLKSLAISGVPEEQIRAYRALLTSSLGDEILEIDDFEDMGMDID